MNLFWRIIQPALIFSCISLKNMEKSHFFGTTRTIVFFQCCAIMTQTGEHYEQIALDLDGRRAGSIAQRL